VHKIQSGYKITPLSQNYSPPTVKIDPSVDMKTPPKVQVDTMPAEKYFAYAAELLKVIPPHITDQPMIAQLKKIGFEPGKSFELGKANPAIRKALESVWHTFACGRHPAIKYRHLTGMLAAAYRCRQTSLSIRRVMFG
jgi:hypothetical protein